jgi:hypothetical protein
MQTTRRSSLMKKRTRNMKSVSWGPWAVANSQIGYRGWKMGYPIQDSLQETIGVMHYAPDAEVMKRILEMEPVREYIAQLSVQRAREEIRNLPHRSPPRADRIVLPAEQTGVSARREPHVQS